MDTKDCKTAGFSTPWQPGNPSRFNLPPLQSERNYVNANDRRVSPQLAYDRHGFDPNVLPVLDVRDYYDRVSDGNANNYMPRRFPDPGLVTTSFPAAKLRPVNANGRVNALNPRVPRAMPPSGTNDTGFIVTTF
jgi:hypothetical protein